MGQLGCTYAVKASRDVSLATEFGFNVYSYESGVRVGCELWRRRRRTPGGEVSEEEEEDGDDGAGGWAREKMQGFRRRGRPLDAAQEMQQHRRHGVRGGDDDGSGGRHPGRRGEDEDDEEDVQGVLKARVDQRGRIGVLWEGKVKELLLSAGVEFDLRRKERMWRGVGVEVAYSS
jgi:distribution and morphology protein 10